MKITKDWLKKHNACKEGTEWFNNQNETDSEKVIVELLKQNHFEWANWTIVRLMTNEQNIQYAIYAAESVIHIYEAKYPDNKAPRKAIEAAKNYLKNQTNDNNNLDSANADCAYDAAAYDAAAYDAAACAYAADCAYDAAAYDAAAYAYDAAACAYAADCAYDAAAYDAAAYAYDAAAYAYDAACGSKELKSSIIKYGLKLIKNN